MTHSTKRAIEERELTRALAWEYVEGLKQEVKELKQRVAELEAILKNGGKLDG